MNILWKFNAMMYKKGENPSNAKKSRARAVAADEHEARRLIMEDSHKIGLLLLNLRLASVEVVEEEFEFNES